MAPTDGLSLSFSDLDRKFVDVREIEKMGAQIALGGFGYAKEYHVERLVREALLFRIVPVTPQMLLSFIAGKALGLPKSY